LHTNAAPAGLADIAVGVVLTGDVPLACIASDGPGQQRRNPRYVRAGARMMSMTDWKQPRRYQVSEVNDEQAQQVYGRINRTWRLATPTDKRNMIAELKGVGGSALAGTVAKLIDEIETELRLQELDPGAEF